MQGDKAVAVGLSLTFHACVAWMVLARLAVAPGLLPGPSVRVSIEAPALMQNPTAVMSEAVRPSGAATAAQASAASSAIVPIAAIPSAPAASEAQSLKEIDAAAEFRPLAGEPASQPASPPAMPLPALPATATSAVPPDTDARPLALDAPVEPSALGTEPMQAAPALAPSRETPGTTLSEQTAAGAMSSNTGPAEPAAPSQPTAVPAAAAPVLSETTAPESTPPASPATPTTDVARAAPDLPAAPPSAMIASATPQATVDVARTETAPALADEATMAPLGPTEAQQNSISASLAPPDQGTAIDLDAAIVPAPPTDAVRAQQIRTFVEHYDGGPCFFASVRRVSAAGADIESFSTAPDTFTRFDHALRTSTGIEPNVSGQRIWSPQCAAVDWLRQLPRPTETATILDLARRDLQNGQVLSGTIQGAGGTGLGLFVISETGAVTDVSDALSEHNGTPAFAFQPPPTRNGGPYPQILLLVTGPAPLPRHPASIDALFKPLIAAKGIGYSVAAKMFLVTR